MSTESRGNVQLGDVLLQEGRLNKIAKGKNHTRHEGTRGTPLQGINNRDCENAWVAGMIERSRGPAELTGDESNERSYISNRIVPDSHTVGFGETADSCEIIGKSNSDKRRQFNVGLAWCQTDVDASRRARDHREYVPNVPWGEASECQTKEIGSTHRRTSVKYARVTSAARQRSNRLNPQQQMPEVWRGANDGEDGFQGRCFLDGDKQEGFRFHGSRSLKRDSKVGEDHGAGIASEFHREDDRAGLPERRLGHNLQVHDAQSSPGWQEVGTENGVKVIATRERSCEDRDPLHMGFQDIHEPGDRKLIESRGQVDGELTLDRVPDEIVDYFERRYVADGRPECGRVYRDMFPVDTDRDEREVGHPGHWVRRRIVDVQEDIREELSGNAADGAASGRRRSIPERPRWVRRGNGLVQQWSARDIGSAYFIGFRRGHGRVSGCGHGCISVCGHGVA